MTTPDNELRAAKRDPFEGRGELGAYPWSCNMCGVEFTPRRLFDDKDSRFTTRCKACCEKALIQFLESEGEA